MILAIWAPLPSPNSRYSDPIYSAPTHTLLLLTSLLSTQRKKSSLVVLSTLSTEWLSNLNLMRNQMFENVYNYTSQFFYHLCFICDWMFVFERTNFQCFLGTIPELILDFSCFGNCNNWTFFAYCKCDIFHIGMDSTTSIVRLVKLINLEGKATYCTIWTISVYISLPSLGSLKLCWYWQDPDAPPLLLHKNFLPPYFLFYPFPLTSRCFCLILIWNYRKYEEKAVKHKTKSHRI